MEATIDKYSPERVKLFLQDELIRRIGTNPRYSLRAFAKSLSVDASLLSKLLKGKRKVSRRLIGQICERMALSPTEVLGLEEAARHDDSSKDDYKQLALDHFHLVADWYHYAILALTRVEGFRSSPKWIAKALEIAIPEVQIALERLQRLGLLKADKKGVYRETNDFITNEKGAFSAPAMRRLQKQVLEMAIKALEQTPIENRDQSSITLELDTSLLEEARTRIKRFRRQLCKDLQRTRKYDQVYHLSISLYPITNINEGDSK